MGEATNPEEFNSIDDAFEAGLADEELIDNSPEEYRIFLQKGIAIPMDKELKGTYMKVKFKTDVRTVLDKIIYNGIAHHVSVVYGNFIKPFEVLAKIKNWKIIF